MNRYNRPYLAGAEENARGGCGCTRGEVEGNATSERGCDRNRGCGHDNPCADCLPLAIATVLSQPFENLHDPMTGWHRGTIFIDLDKPYEGGCCR